jgi:O-antigen/teichoic acid export membrane protein
MENTDAKRLARNTVTLFVRMVLVLIVTLYASRVVLRTLGFDDFGIYTAVASVVIFFGFLKNALTNATSRYLAFELGRGDTEQLKKTFSMAVNCHVILAAALWILLEIGGLWFIGHKLNVGPERLQAAKALFQFSLLTFCISIVQTPFQSNIIAHEKMDGYAVLSVLDALLKLAAAFLIVLSPIDRLVSYGLLLFVVALLILICYIVYNVVSLKDTRYVRSWDGKLVGQFASYSGWSLLVNAADVTTQQCIAIFVFNLIGKVASAAIGVANQVSAGIGMFIANFSQSYKPQIVKSYASGDLGYFHRLLFSASKISFILYLLIAVPIVANIDFVLRIWLGDYPPLAPSYITVIVIYFLFDSFQEPLWQAVHATGKLRTHQIMIASIKFLAIPAMYFVLKAGHSGAAALAVWAGLNVVCAVARTLYMKHLINLDLKAYLSRVILRITVLFLAVVPVSFWIARTLGSNWKGFLVSSAVSVALVLAVGVFFVLDSNERGLLKSVPILGKLIK